MQRHTTLSVCRLSMAVLVGCMGLPVPDAMAAEAEKRLRISLPEALKRASESAPEVVLAKRGIVEAEANRVGAGVILPVNPKLSVDVRPGITKDAGTKPGFAAMMETQFEISNAAGARVREANRRVDVAQVEVTSQVLQARARAWSAYVMAQVSELRVKQSDADVAIGERVLAASRERLNVGASGSLDVTVVEAELAELKALREVALAERESAQMELRQVLDVPASTELELTTSVEAPADVLPTPQLVELALKARPELAATNARIALQETVDERLAKEAAPKVGVYLGLDAAPVSPIFGIAGLSFELPVAQRNQGPRALAQKAKETELDRLVLERRRIEREVTVARMTYDARLKQLSVLAQQAVPSAERTLSLVETGWHAGRFDVFRVTTAARDLARIRRQRLETLLEAWIDRVALERVVGTELPPSGGAL